MLYQVLVRAITRGNYTSKEDIKEKIGLLYSADKITSEQYVDLMFLLEEVN